MPKGYIKLYRSVLGWQWINDPNTLRLWLQILCTVVWERTEFKGITLEAGQRIASIRRLSEETGLTVRQVRTAKDHLIDTGEVTASDTAYGDLLTVVNWAKFQSQTEPSDTESGTSPDKQTTQKATSERHKNEEDKEIKNNYYFARTHAGARTHDAIKEESGREVRAGIWLPETPPQTAEEKRQCYFMARDTFRAYQRNLKKENDDD